MLKSKNKKLELKYKNIIENNNLINKLDYFDVEEYGYLINSILTKPIDESMSISLNEGVEKLEKEVEMKIEDIVYTVFYDYLSILEQYQCNNVELESAIDVLTVVGKLHIKRLTNNRFFSDVEESSLVAKSEEHKNDIEEIEERYQDY